MSLELPHPTSRLVIKRLPDRDLTVRATLVVVVTVLAYHHSLNTLVRNLTLDTPLAYLGLVPLIALGLSVLVWRHGKQGPNIHDRQLDYIVGVPLVTAALAANRFFPSQMSTLFWIRRLDMLSLPVFVAGSVCLLLGTRSLVRLKVPIAFLFLAWPYPYTLAIFRFLDPFTNLTISALARVVDYIPLATRQSTGDGSLFLIEGPRGPFSMSIASSCSGANSLLGFVLVGLASMVLVNGTRLRKAAWLMVGAVVIWMLNVVRIMVIFFAADRWGEGVAIKAFHPFMGLILFNVGIVGMLILMRPFGLRFVGAGNAGGTGEYTASPPPPPRRAMLPDWRSGVAVTVVAALSLAMLNADFSRYELVADALGSPRLTSFVSNPKPIAGWGAPNKIDSYPWAKRFFGDSSNWDRFLLQPTDTTGPLWSSSAVIADVITGSSLSNFNAYGVEACYRFHNYKLTSPTNVELGGGIVGTALSWKTAKGTSGWSAVFWHWPVLVNGSTRYERVTLLLSDSDTVQVRSPDIEIAQDAAAQNAEAKLKGHLRDERKFLVALARELVTNQATST
jgi:exosortase/archaeosortase family protein